MNYQHIVLEGLPYDRGFTHGRAAAGKILKSLEHYHKPGKLLPWDISVKVMKDVYLPGIRKYFPEALPELQGIADGAEVDFMEIMFLNSRYDLARIRGKSIRPCPSQYKDRGTVEAIPRDTASDPTNAHHAVVEVLAEQEKDEVKEQSETKEEPGDLHELQECTTAGFLSEAMETGDVVLAQNWDMSASIFLNDTALYLEIHPDASEDLPVMFLTTEAGQLGRSGFNSAGLGVCASSLMSTEDYFPLDLLLPAGVAQTPVLPMSLLRRQFLHNTNFANALINVRNAPRHVSNKLVVATADNFVMGLEVTPSAVHLCYPEGSDNFTVHSNHAVSNSFHAGPWTDRYPGGSSWYRSVRVARALRASKSTLLAEEKITEAFSDHLALPSSVCQHLENCTVKNVPDYPYKGAQMTVAHIRYNLTQRTAAACRGPPCIGQFDIFRIAKTGNAYADRLKEEIKVGALSAVNRELEEQMQIPLASSQI